MGYRGQDLDLRTPQTWRASPSDLPSAGKLNGPRGRSGYGGDEAIWVDDTVLACSNHAFDVALAHRAGEVRVEHLIHAMTRIDDAAEALEASGVRVASLRRDVATVIASEIPVDLGTGAVAPRSSAGLEEVLRLASAHAHQTKDTPAGVDDLLYVLRELRPQGTASELIDRHMVRVRERASPPNYRRTAPPMYVPDAPRERVRRPAGRYFVNDTAAALPEIQTVTDSMQNSRLDALEQMVRAISSQISHQRDDTSRFSGGLFDRLQSLEDMMAAQPRYDLGSIDTLMRRLDDIEAALRSATRNEQLDLSGIQARLDQIEARLGQGTGGDVAALTSRIEQIDQCVRALPVTDVSSRLDQIEWNVRQTPFVDLSSITMRIDQLEQSFRNNQPYVNVDLSGVDQRVGDAERNLGLALSQGLSGLESRIDNRTDLTNIQHRLDVIEEAILGQDRTMGGDLDSRMASLSEALSLQQTTIEDVRAGLTADVREVAASLVEQSSRIARTGEGIAELVRIVEAERTDDTQALAGMSERLEAYRGLLEGFATRTDAELKSQRDLLGQHHKGVEAFAVRAAEVDKAHNVELKQVHDALMKLNANQHTLASTIDQWRTEGSGDLAIIASRVQTIEREAGKPMALLSSLSANMDNLNRMTVERYHRRNRFWYWLFGTDDWIGASWPSQMEKIEAERRSLKAASR